MENSTKLVHVVVGIIYNRQGEVLIALRPKERYLGGMWEFPGGKVEINELAFSALQRELNEELGISVLQAKPLMQQHYSYPHMDVNLDVWEVEDYQDEPWGRECQVLRWVQLSELPTIQFPHGNKTIVERLCSAN